MIHIILQVMIDDNENKKTKDSSKILKNLAKIQIIKKFNKKKPKMQNIFMFMFMQK